MGKIFDFIKDKLTKKEEGQAQVEPIDYRDDYETRDKTVKKMRQHVRRFMDQDEKEQLKKIIMAKARERNQRFLLNNPYKSNKRVVVDKPTKPCVPLLKQKNMFKSSKKRKNKPLYK